MDELRAAEANDRVARGAAWLDGHYPGWEFGLLDRVDITSGASCVLGQLFGSFGRARSLVPDVGGWLVDHGFLSSEEGWLSEEDLSPAWEALVYARGARRFLSSGLAPPLPKDPGVPLRNPLILASIASTGQRATEEGPSSRTVAA